MPEKSETNLVNGGAGWFFTGLDPDALYTIQIDGNVKGHVSVYSVN
ncbi:hypothetical protein PMI05_05172 [Brevibacillus sp. BC25]|nr:hypothetical protein PMI05_05172 [Brevibacillus sp. BC25]